MRKAVTSLLVLAAFAATFLAGARYPQPTAVSASVAGPRVLYYICPMHPGYTSDRPGDAPCCGMRLEPVYAGDQPTAAGAGRTLPAGAVGVNAWQQQLIGVQVEAVGEASGSDTLRLAGRIAPDERLVYSLNAGLEGTIREDSGVTTGSRVRKHQVLATYTAPDFLLAVQSFILALDGLEKLKAARAIDAAANTPDDPGAVPPVISRNAGGIVVNSGSSNFQQRIDRLHLLGMSDLQIEEVRQMRDVPYSIKIVAPADGTVIVRNITPGYKFARGEEWFRIADLRRVWVLVDVPGSEVQHVRAGREVRVRIPDQGKTFVARVSSVAPQFDAQTRTFKVRLEAANPDGILWPDMFVDVELPVAFSSTIAVPDDAVVDTGLRKTIYVERTPGVFEPREVETGWQRGDRVEILHGLSPGDRIVTSGTFLLDSESRMRSAAVLTTAVTKASDPVCQMEVDKADAKAAGRLTDRDGTTHYFCSKQCKDQFDSAPASAGQSKRAPGGKS